MRHALIERSWRASVRLFLVVLGFALIIPGVADAQEPAGCPNWNLHYGSPTDAAKVYTEGPTFVNTFGAQCVPVSDLQCTVSTSDEWRYNCTAKLKNAIGCTQIPVGFQVTGSGPPVVSNDYITFGNPGDGRGWCGRWPPYAGKNTGPPDCPNCCAANHLMRVPL